MTTSERTHKHLSKLKSPKAKAEWARAFAQMARIERMMDHHGRLRAEAVVRELTENL